MKGTECLSHVAVGNDRGRGGLTKDEREAARLYKLATDQGFARAQTNLGQLYAHGLGGWQRTNGKPLVSTNSRPIRATLPHRTTLPPFTWRGAVVSLTTRKKPLAYSSLQRIRETESQKKILHGLEFDRGGLWPAPDCLPYGARSVTSRPAALA
jgi:TPR repeat protein